MSFIAIFVLSFVCVVVYIWWQQKKEADMLDFRAGVANKNMDLTQEELKKYDGSNYGVVFVAVKGEIFDVSDSAFYKKPSSYAIFAGKDATVALAKYDLTGEWCNKTQSTELSEEEKEVVGEWHAKFSEKYRIVGKIKF